MNGNEAEKPASLLTPPEGYTEWLGDIKEQIPEDDGVFYGWRFRQGWGLAQTNPVQTWLDLRHAGGRGEEAAEAVLKEKFESVDSFLNGNTSFRRAINRPSNRRAV